MTKYILKKITQIHCAKEPKRCNTCKEYAKEKKWALLEITPAKNPLATRPLIEIEIEGEMVFQPFDVIKYFDMKKDAIDYTEEINIEIKIINEI